MEKVDGTVIILCFCCSSTFPGGPRNSEQDVAWKLSLREAGTSASVPHACLLLLFSLVPVSFFLPFRSLFSLVCLQVSQFLSLSPFWCSYLSGLGWGFLSWWNPSKGTLPVAVQIAYSGSRD